MKKGVFLRLFVLIFFFVLIIIGSGGNFEAKENKVKKNSKPALGVSLPQLQESFGLGFILSDYTSNEYPQALIPFITLEFTAPPWEDVIVTQLNFNRKDPRRGNGF